MNSIVISNTAMLGIVVVATALAQPGSVAGRADGDEASSLVTNAGFETGDAAPEGWKKGAAVPGVQYIWDKEVARSGKASLCLKKTARRYFPIAQWVQDFEHRGGAGELEISAYIKAQKAYKAVIDVQFTDAKGRGTHEWVCYIGAKESGDPSANHDWKAYTGRVAIPAGTKRIALALQIYGPGTVWFDDLRVTYATVQVPSDALLVNGGFEEGDRSPVGWRETKTVAGVTATVDRNVAHEGKASLRMKKTIERYFPIAEWSQGFAHKSTAGKLRVAAWVKAQRAHKAVLDVQFKSGDGKWTHKWAAYIGAKDTGDPPADHDWKEYSDTVPIPDRTEEIRIALQLYGPGTVWFDQIWADYVNERKGDEPNSGIPRAPGHLKPPPDADDVADIPARDLRAGNDPDKRYLLIGPRPQAPAAGFRLLIVMPGGSGGPDFHPFVKRIYKNALADEYLVAQIVAPQWSSEQAKNLVWPTEGNTRPGVKFSTEELVSAVIGDIEQRHKLDPRYVFTLSWSSSGPAAYAISLQPKTRVTGSFIAMSVFKPEQLPPLTNAAGHSYYILHSPQDFIPLRMSQEARDKLRRNKAVAELATYDGGHGWHGDVFGHISKGVRWLEEHVK